MNISPFIGKPIVMIAFLLLLQNIGWSSNLHVTTRSLSANTAHQLAKAAYDACSKQGYHVAVAVVNREGRLLAFMRSPLAGAHTIEVSQQKAYAASSFKTATSQLMDRDFMRDIPGVLVFGGGLPINVGGHFYGALGVSGAPAENVPGDTDEACAAKGIEVIATDLEMAG